MSDFFSSLSARWAELTGLTSLTAILIAITAFIAASIGNFFLHDFYRRLWDAFTAKRRRAALTKVASELAKQQNGKDFAFGRISTSVYVLDFCPLGYEPGFLVSEQESRIEEIPEEFRYAYERSLARFTEKLERREIYEGKAKIAPKAISVDRADGTEANRLRITYCLSKGYIHQRAATEVFQSLPEAKRRQLLREPPMTMHPFFSNNLGICVGIITGNGELLFVERGATAVNSGRIVCGAVEGMTVDDLTQGRIDPIRAAQRALLEEFGLNLDPNETSAIRVIACIFNNDFHEWNLVAYVDLRRFGDKYLSATFFDYITTGKPKDKWEGWALTAIPLKPKNIAGFVLAYEKRMTNYAIVTTIYTLLAAHGSREEVARAFDPRTDLD
ncbi:hypothetical protein [Lentisalinibacter sediminis]|uniref:hypothetical protein n=1 Tax=Lentisalinibacter sediminis TaxID=2992237 RepID=UPI003866A751